jgi:hypothetical protein
MLEWYKKSEVCYAYLAAVPAGDNFRSTWIRLSEKRVVHTRLDPPRAARSELHGVL